MDGKKGSFQDITRRTFLSRTSLMTLVAVGGLGSAATRVCWGQSGSSNKAKLREKYRGLSRQELLNKVYEKASAYEAISIGCSQCTAAGLYEFLDFDAVVVKAANSSCGGQASISQGTCGGLIGGTMVIDSFLGRPVEAMTTDPSKDPNIPIFRNANLTARLLAKRYIQEYGTILCPGIMVKLYGRAYYLPDPDEYKKFIEVGSHSDMTKCPRVVGNAAKWTMEILLDKGVVEL